MEKCTTEMWKALIKCMLDHIQKHPEIRTMEKTVALAAHFPDKKKYGTTKNVP